MPQMPQMPIAKLRSALAVAPSLLHHVTLAETGKAYFSHYNLISKGDPIVLCRRPPQDECARMFGVHFLSSPLVPNAHSVSLLLLVGLVFPQEAPKVPTARINGTADGYPPPLSSQGHLTPLTIELSIFDAHIPTLNFQYNLCVDIYT